ncbi:MAG: glycosyltransferase [Verrucomicrobiales bacterium]|jgi:glycosyltransferase involved in cell wall biosynthesis|nr:glycosyltransferase [Verrucomicrobiales bacterium]
MRFSIITPSFKQPDWLKLCISSVKDQVSLDFEVEHIVQDGGSPDIIQIFPEIESEGYSFRLFSENDNGMYDAINRGLQRSSGEICAWLNCDEQYLVGTLAKVANFFKLNPQIDMLFGDALLIDKSGLSLSYRKAIKPDQRHIKASHLNTLSCATFFRRNVFEKYGMLDVGWKIIGDAVWVDHLIAVGVKMAVLNELLSVFTWLPENLSNTQQAESEISQWKSQCGSSCRFKKWNAIITHRLRKLKSGAYRVREIQYAVYTRDSTNKRRGFQRRVGWKWPRYNKINLRHEKG